MVPIAVSAKWFGNGLLAFASKQVSWTGDTLVATLHTSSYTPNQDTHAAAADLTNELTTANGYTAGGATLGSKTATYDAASNQVRLDAADVVWTAGVGQTLTARYLVVRSTTADKLLGYVDFGADQSASNGAFTVAWDATGVFTITAA